MIKELKKKDISFIQTSRTLAASLPFSRKRKLMNLKTVEVSEEVVD